VGRDAALGDQVRDPVGDHARLAAAGAREHDERAGLVQDSLPLRRVQAGQVDRPRRAARPGVLRIGVRHGGHTVTPRAIPVERPREPLPSARDAIRRAPSI
jgi:hypothetical protein